MGSEIPQRLEGNVQMNVVKLIAGFLVGVLCLVVSFFILTINALPILSRVVTGSEWDMHPLFVPLSLILNVLAIWIGAGFAPKVWKRGVRSGAVTLALLAVLATLGYFFVIWLALR